VPSPEPCSHLSLLDLTDSLLAVAGPALSFFFAFPTRRLSETLILLAHEATTAVASLAQSPLPATDVTRISEFAASCERIQTAIREWSFAVELESVARDLDVTQAETLH